MYDAIVVGARCAGSPTALLLARKGYKVLLTDRSTFPSDTLLHSLHPSIRYGPVKAMGIARQDCSVQLSSNHDVPFRFWGLRFDWLASSCRWCEGS